MAAASSPTASFFPPLFGVDIIKITDLAKKKPQYTKVGATTTLDFEKLSTVTTSPRTAVLKAVFSKKKTAFHPYIRVEVKWLRQKGDCNIICDDGQGFMKLKGSEKKDFISTCIGVCTIYESMFPGISISSMAHLVTAKMYILENPANQTKGLYMMTVNPPVTVPTEYLDFDFVKILLFSIDGQELSVATLLAELNTVGTNHDIGLIGMDENQLDGMMYRGNYNTSGGTIMWHVLREFQSLTLGRETMQQKDMLELKLSDLVHSGILSDLLHEAIYIFMDMITETTIGSVEIKFYMGSVTVT